LREINNTGSHAGVAGKNRFSLMMTRALKKSRKYGAIAHTRDAEVSELGFVNTKARLPEYSGWRCSCGGVAATCPTCHQTKEAASGMMRRHKFFREKIADVETPH
jgi:hypothetical protein